MFTPKKYLRGDQEFQVPAHLNFGQYMIQCLRKIDKNTRALINADTGEEMTYGVFLQDVVDISISLAELSIGKGHIVAICSERTNNFVATALAVICTGATYTPLDVTAGKTVVRHSLEITKPSYVICSKLFWDNYKDVLSSFDFIEHYIRFDDVPEHATSFEDLRRKYVDVAAFEAAEARGADDVAMVLYSSGTTGSSKGVLLTHLNLLLSCNSTHFCDSSIKILCNGGQWYHNCGSMAAFVCLSTGKTLVYSLNIEEDKYLLPIIEKYKIEMLLGDPLLNTVLVKSTLLEEYDLSSLKIIYSRCDYLHLKIISDVKKRLPHLKDVIQGYGMTEAGEPTSESRAPRGPRPGSVGTPAPATTLKIVDVNSREPLGPRTTGEICVKGPVLMKGYIGIPQDQYLDEEGFLKTGDLGYYDEDQYVYITNRIKNIIKCCGFQVSPVEIEAVLLQHNAVKEAGVIGRPDPQYGELPTAFVVKQPGAKVTEQELIDFVAIEVSSYMQLQGGVKFVSVLPRNPRGKLLRRELKEMMKQMDEDH